MLTKIADFSFTDVHPLSASDVTSTNGFIMRTAANRIVIEPGSEKSSVIEAEIKKHPNALFFKAKAIEADVANTNGDYFSTEELLKAYKTFEGVPFFTNHNNQNIENARGKIIFAEWNPQEKAVYVLAFCDRDAYPDICRGIEQEYVVGCFPPDAPVLMTDGSEKPICDVEIGDLVISGKGKSRKVLGKRYRGYDHSLLSISVEGIKQPLICTGGHNLVVYRTPDICACGCGTILTPQKDKRKTVKNFSRIFKQSHNNNGIKYNHEYIQKVIASELKVGDLLVEPKINNKIKNSVSEDEAFLIGLFLAEGSFEKRDGIRHSTIFSFGHTELETIAKKCKELLDKLFSSHRNPATINYYPDASQTRVSIYGKDIAEWFYNKCGEYSSKKKISEELMHLDEKTTASLLAGYMEGDGCNVKMKSYSVTTVSPDLASQIRLLFSKIGIRTRYRIRENPGNFGNQFTYLPCHEITFGTTTATSLSEKLLFKKANESPYGPAKWHSCDEYILRPVKSIKDVEYNGTVYDLEIEEDHTYCVNHLAVSNTSMGCSVEHSECNICGNRAEKVENYCVHIRERKGRKFSGKARNVKTGEIKEFKDEPVFEYNYGLKFIELSAVVDPACPSCTIQGVISNNDYLSKVAKLENDLFMIRTAAIEKNASQEEIQQMDEVLQTMETFAINLLKNRKQVEMTFASELVDILSQLQTWLDELIGAGYGNLPGSQVPGTVGDQTQAPAPAPTTPAPGAAPMPAGATGSSVNPMTSETPVGNVSGAPGKPLLQTPKLPITTPVRPRAASTDNTSDSRTIQRIADFTSASKYISSVETRNATGSEIIRKASVLCEKLNKSGDIDMGKRRTITAKQQEKEKVMEILSNSWQEKQDFFEYIKQMPSIQDNEHRLLINKRDDSFIVVGESKANPDDRVVWTYEDLTDEDKKMIQASPKDASVRFLELFSDKSKKQKEGEKIMTDINKNAGATTVNPVPQEVQEAQLRQKGLYHSRTETEQNQVTQAQLESLRKGEKDYITEKQLNDSELKLNPRTNEEAQEVQEAQLKPLREDDEKNTVTQDQLKSQRKDKEPEVVTERQLKDTPAPWARTPEGDSTTYKSASDHMKSVINVLAESVMAAGCAPEEACQVASSLVDTTDNRVYLKSSIKETSETKEAINYGKRIAFWNNKNLKVASTGKKEIAQLIVDGLRKVAADKTINPDVLISALDVISEESSGVTSITRKVEEKIAEASKEIAKVSLKSELKAALESETSSKESRDAERDSILEAATSKDVKMQREAERKAWEKVLNKEAAKGASHMIETSFTESGLKKDDPSFKSGIVSFARGALASQSLKLAAVTNVTISGDTIQIAVQTDEGESEVEIPIGDESAPATEETVPEGDMTGEGLEGTLSTPPSTPATPPAPAGAAMPMASASKKMTKQAQAPMGGGVPGTPGGVSAPGASEQGLPGPLPEGDAIQSLTQGDVGAEGPEGAEDVPTIGEQQMPWTICPECGSSDVDVTNEEGNIKGKCNKCAAEYEALIKKEVEFKITKPTVSVGKPAGEGEAAPEAPAETPEVPSLPVAAQTRIDKGTIVRIAENRKAHGHVCPACGHKSCKASKDGDGHSEYSCPACKTDVVKDIMISSSDPSQSYLRVRWDIRPSTSCKGCPEEVAKFASKVKMAQMIKTAATNKDSFPMANCIERMARQYGGNTVATFGPCKGKLLADCTCKELQKLGFTKIKDMVRLASASMQKDPLDECVEDQKKKGHGIKEATHICNCLKKKFASELSDNIYAHAFGQDIVDGKETRISAQDLATLHSMALSEAVEEVKRKLDAIEAANDADIGSDLPALKEAEVEVELVKEAQSKSVCHQCQQPAVLGQSGGEVCGDKACPNFGKPSDVITGNFPPPTAANPLTVAKDTSKTVKEAKGFFCDKCKKPTKSCECTKDDGDDGDDGGKKKDDGADKKEAMAMNGQRIRSVNEEVFNMASLKTAGTPTKVDSIEGNVEAGVPRKQAYMGEEAKADSMINKTPKKPEIPRSDAYMGHEKEADSMINVELKLPDVAVDSAYMGKEKEIQSGMPAINNEIKGTVIATDKKSTKQAKQMKEVDTVEKDVEAGVPRSDAKMGEESKAEGHINAPNKGPDVPRSDAYMGKEKEADSMINETLKGPDVPIDNAYMGHEKEVQKDMPGINDEMLKQVKMQREEQLNKIAAAREKQAMKVASWLVGNGRIPNDLEAFEATVKALSAFEIDKIVTVASMLFPARTVKTSSSTQEIKTASESHAIPAIVMESKNKSAEDNREDFVKKLAGAFTVGNTKFDHDLTVYGERK